MTNNPAGTAGHVEETAENVYKIQLPMPFEPHIINVYLLRETNRMALVDCGMPMAAAWHALKAGFQALNLQVSDLTDIFLTHWHVDHIGALPKIRQTAPEARIFFHQLDYDFINRRATFAEESRDTLAGWLKSLGTTQLGAQDMFNFRMEPPQLQPGDRLVEGGEEIRFKDEGDGWEIVWTPGHTNGHFVLYNRQRQLLLSGDQLLTDISSNIGKFPETRQDPLGDFLNSLDKLGALEVAQVLPAHGGPFNDHRRRIAELKEHHRRRMEKILGIIDNGSLTVQDVADTIWADRLEGFNRYLALMEINSHLERLRQEGKVSAEDREGVIYFQAS